MPPRPTLRESRRNRSAKRDGELLIGLSRLDDGEWDKDSRAAFRRWRSVTSHRRRFCTGCGQSFARCRTKTQECVPPIAWQKRHVRSQDRMTHLLHSSRLCLLLLRRWIPFQGRAIFILVFILLVIVVVIPAPRGRPLPIPSRSPLPLPSGNYACTSIRLVVVPRPTNVLFVSPRLRGRLLDRGWWERGQRLGRARHGSPSINDWNK